MMVSRCRKQLVLLTDSGNLLGLGRGGGGSLKMIVIIPWAEVTKWYIDVWFQTSAARKMRQVVLKGPLRITTIRRTISHKNANLVNSCTKRMCCPLPAFTVLCYHLSTYWRGVTFHKRRQCPFCAISVITFLLQQFKLSKHFLLFQTDAHNYKIIGILK